MKSKVTDAVKFAEEDIAEAVSIDTIAGEHIHSQTLKLIYETIVNLAYGLFLVGMTISLSISRTVRDNFVNYLGRDSSLPFLIVIASLAIISYTLSKAYKKDKKYQPATKRSINLLQDIVKGAIFVLMLVFVTSFVKQNKERWQIVAAYVLYVVSMALFKILHIIKWYYYLLGTGKGKLEPWESQPSANQFLSKEQRNALIEMTNAYLSGLVQNNQIKLNSGRFEMLPTSER